MTPENFTYWLQGWVELSGATPTEEQWKSIKDHLKTVFNKVTPDVNMPFSYPHAPSTQPYPYPYGTEVIC